MIRLRDAAVLAATKLRTRKARTIVTAVLASLLFAVLVFAFTAIKGAISSYAAYSKNGLSGRYIASVQYSNGSYVATDSPELIVLAKERNKQIIEQKKADAKRLGLTYNAAEEPPVTMMDTQSGSAEYLNTSNLAAQQVYAEAVAKLPTALDSAKKAAAAYHPKAFYNSDVLGDTNGLVRMKQGKEAFETADKSTSYQMDTLTTLSYLPMTVSEPFLLQGADLSVATTTESSIPVIVPYDEAEIALGLKSLPKTATNTERLARIDEVKRHAANVTVTVCYRNAASQQQVETTKQQIAEIAKHKGDRTYEMPSQIYALPDQTSCGAVVVTKDTRTAEEKSLAAKQSEFNIKYGVESVPVQKKLTFRIVGLAPNAIDYSSFSTLESLATLIGGSSLRGQWVVPTELVDASVRGSFIPQASNDTQMMVSSMTVGVLAEFSNAQDAKKFVEEQGCSGMDCMTKPFITYFGSNSVLIDSLFSKATTVLKIAGLVVSIIAAILMMGMVGRVITDSRRETAVFRAIGAKRNDIRAIYALYVLAFSLIIALSALCIGTGVAWLYSLNVSDSLTTSARLMFIESHETAPFVLVGAWPAAIFLTIGVIVLAGLVAMLLPLSRNLVRSPLKDMRDE